MSNQRCHDDDNEYLERGIYLLLFDELGVWAVVHDVGPEDRRSELAIDLLRIDILQLSIEDKFISIRPKINGSLLSQENEREDVAVLASTLDIEISSL